MRKWIAAFALLLLATLVVSSFMTRRRPATPEPDRWPLGLGALEAVPSRYPASPSGEGAGALDAIAARLGIGRTVGPFRPPSPLRGQITEYVQAEIGNDRPDAEPPPPAVKTFLEKKGDAIAELRRIVLSGRSFSASTRLDLVSRAPVPDLAARAAMTRMLVAHALMMRGDAVAAEDLHAAWTLQKDLWQRPELISALVALGGTRLVNGAVRKLDAGPLWFSEIERFDVRRSMLAAQQAETWMMLKQSEQIARDGEEENVFRRAVDGLRAPYLLVSASNFAAATRDVASGLATSERCAIDSREFGQRLGERAPWWNVYARLSTPSLGSVWSRVGRFRAEREGTVKAMQIRSGSVPSPASECSDGRWLFDGRRLRFSRIIPVDRAGMTVVPLDFAVR